MQIERFQIRRIYYPYSKREDDYFAIKLNGQMYRTDDKGKMDEIVKELERFLEHEKEENREIFSK